MTSKGPVDLPEKETSERISDTKDLILSEWEKAAVKEVAPAKWQGHFALLDHLPHFLDQMCQELSQSHSQNIKTLTAKIAQEHGKQRAKLTEYSLGGVLKEYQILRDVIVRSLLEGGPLNEADREIINHTIDKGIEEAAEAFAKVKMDDEKRINEKMEAALRVREDVLGVVSHDLKNPLSAILLNSKMIINSQKLDTNVQKGERIYRSAKRMEVLIEDILDFAKMQSGKMTLEIQVEDSSSLVDDTIEMLKPLAAAKGISLQVKNPPQKILVRCDHKRIVQVFSNLIGNSIKFTDESGNITLSSKLAGSFAEFCISDSGRGISNEDLPNIFNRYWQSPETARQGSGLGLSIAKAIVESHGGSIWVKSKLGHGSEFYFTLPTSPQAHA